MKIMDFLHHRAVTTDIKAKTKKEIIAELLDLLVNAGVIRNKDVLYKVLLEREALGSTGIGQGVAIPHAKSDGVKKLVAAFGISKEGVDFASLDGEPVYIFFLIAAPDDCAGPHLKALARISRILKDKCVRDLLRDAVDAKAILKIIKQEDLRN
ncbi:MAG: PTS sugar transporter subunit IIA [Candidatus Omnitrophota bacterium]|nr:MAG: PTS sugar transporter subunit IIA [Candidatus Omnitrophota bacterium]